jgi:hypothetical protein
VESGGFQRGEKEGGHGEDGNRRLGNGEKRGKDCGSNITGGAAANTATPGKDDGIIQTEQRRRCNEDRTDAGIEDGHATPQTANVCGDSHAQRESKNDICRSNSHGQTEHPPHGDRRQVGRNEEGRDERDNN